ncbi:MAG TPA: peroxiredoxin-like family protein [Geminicoccaceae bacterium]|nr:peroxiredoxin-like family protein [Geminicoccus sp.]HMU49983.1 peroxiredoxin-like family protein [Geminicoccaceae bacterium]
MSLEEKLAAVRQATAQKLSAESRRTIAETIERNRMLQLAEQSLRVGDVLPDFALPDTEGRIVTSGELLDRGPLVAAFFRGEWCPYCDVALRDLDAAWPAIRDAGASLVGILPERPEQLQVTAELKGIDFPLLSDAESRFSALCGVRYAIPDEHITFYRRAGIDLGERSGTSAWWLPLPAAYVVRQDGVIVEAFVNPDWSYRAESEALVMAARAAAGETA